MPELSTTALIAFLILITSIAAPIFGFLGIWDFYIWRKSLRPLVTKAMSRTKIQNLQKKLQKTQYRQSARRQEGWVIHAISLYGVAGDICQVLDIRRPAFGDALVTQELILYKPSPSKHHLVLTNIASDISEDRSQRNFGWPRHPIDQTLLRKKVPIIGYGYWTIFSALSLPSLDLQESSELALVLNSLHDMQPVWVEMSELGIFVATSLNVPKYYRYSPFGVNSKRIQRTILLAHELALAMEKAGTSPN